MAAGKKGEQLAEEYLLSLGYKMHARNVRIHSDEIDLIAYDPEDKAVVFVEVKSRSVHNEDFGAFSNLTHKKKKNIRRSARAWIHAREYTGSFRIDVIGIEGGVVSHIKDMQST